ARCRPCSTPPANSRRRSPWRRSAWRRARPLLTRSGDASGDSDYGDAPGMTAIRVGNVETLTARNGSIRIRYAGTHAERRLPAWQVFEENFDAKAVQGAIVFVGATASALYDLRATPLEPN